MTANTITPNQHNPIPDPCDPMIFQIRIRGHLDPQWSGYFEGLAIELDENGTTLLTGPLDQASLHGLFKKVRDLGLQLVSVNPVEQNLDRQSETDPGGQS